MNLIHPFWKKLSTTPNPIDRGDLDYQDKFALFVDHYQNSSADQKKKIVTKIEGNKLSAKYLVDPSSNKSETKGKTVASVQHVPKKRKISSVQKAPKESPKKTSQNVVASKKVVALKKATKNHVALISMKEKYLPLVHESFHQYVEDLENVSGDGNCGFRAVTVGMGFGKGTGWIQVRQDLVEEIDTWMHDLYDKMWHDDGASKLRTIIDWYKSSCYSSKYMLMPETGYLIARGGEWKYWALPRVEAYTEAFRNLQLLTDAGVEPYAIILSDVDDDDDLM
ncbi:hypothetical protein IFM89_004281 [Coptis chinensis]|uniref:OTU domain-containing protein n=1 Tax=Coptis chinensis TaxID=261450 RepID=A0A835LZ34_9MAGN|nr:hypothetical protein IFM89_004281 [Coptis chinensis]